MEKKNAQLTVTIGDKVFLISGCELTAYKLPDSNGNGGWVWHSPVPPPPPPGTPIKEPVVMEGRSWHKEAAERGAVIRPNMQRGKFYLHQLYTTCFVEFDTLEQVRRFRQYADENLPYWNYDPVATIDTNDEKTVQQWAAHMEERTWHIK